MSVLVFLMALPAVASGQSLGDAAKKERERRAKLREAGTSARTVTEDDLATTKGKLANDPKAKTATSEASESATRDQGTTVERRQVRPQADPSRNLEEYWRGRVAAARARVAAAEQRSRALEAMIRFGQPAEDDATNPTRVIHSIYRMKEAADAAAAELAAAQANLESVLDEGRRAGALPGWLR